MKVNEIIVEAELADLWKKVRGISKEPSAKNNTAAEYNRTLDLFQKELETSAPEEANELSELRKDYAARPSAAAAQRIARFIQDRATYVQDKENAANAVQAAADAAAKLRGTQAIKVGSYPAPKAVPAGSPNPSVDVNGIAYTYDYSVKSWKDPNGNVVTDNNDVVELNKRYYDQSGSPSGGGASPAEIRTAAQKAAQQKADTTAQPVMPAVFRRRPRTQPAAQPAQPAAQSAQPAAQPQALTPQQKQAAARKKAQGELGNTTMRESIDFAEVLWNRMRK